MNPPETYVSESSYSSNLSEVDSQSQSKGPLKLNRPLIKIELWSGNVKFVLKYVPQSMS